MARRQNRQRPKAGGSSEKRAAQDAKALKSMLLGMGLLTLLSAFFLMPVGGQTLFNRLIGLFDGGSVAEPADGPGSAAATGVVGTPPRGAKPMEKVSPKQEAELDDIIDKARKP